MIAMRLCAALALVLVALVVVTVRAAQRHPRRPAAVSVAPDPVEAPRAARAPTWAPPPSVPTEPTGVATLRGRVLLPAGVTGAGDLDVVAEGTVRTFDAHVPDDAHYEIHLPSGRYTLIASMGELVGVVPDVLARAGATRDVDIRLAVGAVIRGRVKAASEVVVRASAPGTSTVFGDAQIADGRFSIAGLIPGRRYDITFEGNDVRKVTIPGVTAPTDGLDVEVVPLAKVSGAIGFPRGERCPINDVYLRFDGSDDDDHGSDTVGRDCKFALVAPENVASVTIVATGNGWNLEQEVAIPPTSDPEPICLNPPCRSEALTGLARLRISVDVPEGSWRHVTVKEVGPTTPALIYSNCDEPDGVCVVEGLPAGTTYTIRGTGDNCSSDAIETTVVAGANHVHLPCHEQRQVEGVVRARQGEQPGDLAVRCAGSHEHQMVVNTHFFYISCNANAASLEYQIGESGSWRSVPIATAADPALVDIDL